MDLLHRIFKENHSSKDTAVERLRLVLIHDRASISPGIMEAMKEDLIQVLSKYMEIDREAMDVSLNSSELTASLVANIPVKSIRR